MKTERQSKLLEIIYQNDIETQSELLERLNEYGFHATQATVSRDIKELRLIKIPNGKDKYKYAAESAPEDERHSHSYLFTTAVTSIDYSRSLVVIKTKGGMAQAVCAALDSTNRPGVMGTIAGDDTIFVATRSDSASAGLAADLKKLMSAKA